MTETRREFLVKIAKGSVYSAPVIRTLAAPEGLSAQANPSEKSGGKSGGGWGKGQNAPAPTTDFQFGPSAPWSNDP
ncbi:MAG: hypothetical protein ACLFWG_03605 [Longimicrobiales bacterium]